MKSGIQVKDVGIEQAVDEGVRKLYVYGTNLCHLMDHLKTDHQYEAILLSILPRCGPAFQKLVGL